MVPGLICMNVIQNSHDLLKQKFGSPYWASPILQQREIPLKQALEICQLHAMENQYFF